VDTGSLIDLIDRPTLAKYFGDVKERSLPEGEEIQLTGISKGLVTRTVAELDFSCLTMEKEMVPFYAKAYVVDHLPGGTLLGLGFLKQNLLYILWGKDRDPDKLRIGDTDKHIQLFTWKDRARSYTKARIYLVEATTVLLGTGQNLVVRHRRLPLRASGYLLTPYPTDMAA
jgi:hypothetical protein